MRNFQMDDTAYNEILNLLNNQHFVERVGEASDMSFLSEDEWLKDTAVIDNVIKRKGFWEIHLVFAHYQSPLKLIKRVITRFTNKRKALLSANLMRRLAAKDQRGTLALNLDDFKLNAS